LRPPSQKLRLIADQIDVVSCDARKYPEQSQKYGVSAYQGAFTVYNFNSRRDSVVEATLIGISAGRRRAPVLGSGVLVGGSGDDGGRVEVDELTTGEIHSNEMIPPGTSDLIAAGVFVLNSVHVKNAKHRNSYDLRRQRHGSGCLGPR
jgi:hypothetical protein